MGRTIPSFRIALEMEKAVWRPFRNALDKSDRKKFPYSLLLMSHIDNNNNLQQRVDDFNRIIIGKRKKS
jgi:hypothetical protein